MNLEEVGHDTVNTDRDLILIEGRSADNRRFRPSDWSERLASNFACFGTDHRLRYSPSVFPVLIDGVPSLMVAKNLEQTDPRAYAFVMQFAVENNLCIHRDRRQGPRIGESDRRKETHSLLTVDNRSKA